MLAKFICCLFYSFYVYLGGLWTLHSSQLQFGPNIFLFAMVFLILFNVHCNDVDTSSCKAVALLLLLLLWFDWIFHFISRQRSRKKKLPFRNTNSILFSRQRKGEREKTIHICFINVSTLYLSINNHFVLKQYYWIFCWAELDIGL